MAGFYYFMYKQSGGGGAMNVGRAKVKDQAEQGRKATFKDVARRQTRKKKNCRRLSSSSKSDEIQHAGRAYPARRAAGGPSGHW